MLEYLEKCEEEESGEGASAIQKLETELKTIDEKLNRLLDGYISGIVEQKDYQVKRQDLINKKFEIKQKLVKYPWWLCPKYSCASQKSLCLYYLL